MTDPADERPIGSGDDEVETVGTGEPIEVPQTTDTQTGVSETPIGDVSVDASTEPATGITQDAPIESTDNAEPATKPASEPAAESGDLSGQKPLTGADLVPEMDEADEELDTEMLDVAAQDEQRADAEMADVSAESAGTNADQSASEHPTEKNADNTVKSEPTEGSNEPDLPNPLARLLGKEKSLKELLLMMEDNPPLIPDAVTDYYLARGGFECSDTRIKRLLALATQKFVSDIAKDAYEYSRIRSSSSVYNAANPQVRARALAAGMSGANTGTNNNSGAPSASSTVGGQGSQGKIVLTMDDLSSSLAEYGLNVRRPDFYR